MAALFVFRIVATRTVGHRNPERKFAIEVRLARNVQSHGANHDDAAFLSRDFTGEFYRLIGFRSCGNQHRIRSTSARPFNHARLGIAIGRATVVGAELSRQFNPVRIEIDSENSTTVRFQKLNGYLSNQAKTDYDNRFTQSRF